MCLSLYSDCHRSFTSPSCDTFKCFPSTSTNFLRCGSLSSASAPPPLGAGLVLLACLLLPPFFRPTQSCVDLYNLFQLSTTPASIQLVFCENCCNCRSILVASAETDAFHATYSSAILTGPLLLYS